MKQFIVLAAALPLLLLFMVQFAADQQYSLAVSAVDDAVYAAKEMAKQEGCFSGEISQWLKEEIAKKIRGVQPEDIIIGSATDTAPVYRMGSIPGGDGLIHYQISVPMRGFSVGSKLLGIRDTGRTQYYVTDTYVPSELLP